MNKNKFLHYIVFIVVTLFCSCEAHYEAYNINIKQNSWELISVDVYYKKKKFFREEYVYPNRERVIIRDSKNNLIYDGFDLSTISIPDKTLGSEERVNIKIIAFFNDKQISSEDYFYSSPKIFTMHNSISYPSGGIAKGTYDICFTVKRKEFNSNNDEIIFSRFSLPFNIKVSTSNSNILFNSKNRYGSFDLSEYSNFETFKSNIFYEVENNGQIEIKFQISADYYGSNVSFQPIIKKIENKSERDKQREAQYFANKVGHQIMKGITPNTGNTLNVTIDNEDLDYDLYAMRYRIPIEVSWWGATWFLGKENKMYIQGILYVNEDGSEPNFEKTWSNSFVQNAVENNAIWQGTIFVIDELNKEGFFD
jgi:hypothetical protein